MAPTLLENDRIAEWQQQRLDLELMRRRGERKREGIGGDTTTPPPQACFAGLFTCCYTCTTGHALDAGEGPVQYVLKEAGIVLLLPATEDVWHCSFWGFSREAGAVLEEPHSKTIKNVLQGSSVEVRAGARKKPCQTGPKCT